MTNVVNYANARPSRPTMNDAETSGRRRPTLQERHCRHHEPLDFDPEQGRPAFQERPGHFGPEGRAQREEHRHHQGRRHLSGPTMQDAPGTPGDGPTDEGGHRHHGGRRSEGRGRGGFGPDGFGPGGSGRGGFGPGGRGGFGFEDMGPQGRGREGRPGRGRARRGDVRLAILALLAEQPMNGYQIIQTLDERTSGVWRPSPGAIYPSLNQLEDEALIEPFDNEGQRAYRLTEAGHTAATAVDTKPWDTVNAESGVHTEGVADLWTEFGQLGAATKSVRQAGSPAQIKAAAQVLSETRKKLFGILAQDD